jgi:tetratricopeptide (TPR) repeat protein
MNGGGKNYFKISAAVFLVVMALAAAWHWGWPAYRQHKESRTLAGAQAAFGRGDYRSAWLGARMVLLLDSNSVPACRIMAGVAEVARSPVALDWWQRIAAFEPTVTNQLALAAAGLRFQNPPFPLTVQILNQLPDTATNLMAFQSVAAELALRMNRLADAERHMELALQLEPTNKTLQLNLAVLRLSSTNPAVVTEARKMLNGFRTDTNLGPAALRSLVAERLMHDDLPAAHDYSTQLLASAQVTLADRLQQLGILKRLQSPDLAAQLNAVQQTTATNAALAAQTASWMEANGFMTETVNWLNSLPAGIQSRTPVQLALVDYYIGTTNWQGLSKLTTKSDWGEMNFLRLAFLSHAWSELGQPVVADVTWSSAVNQANNQLGALNALLELAIRWNMKSEQENLLWRIVRRFPDAGWAQQNLERLYLSSGDTEKLYQLYSERLARFPQSTELKNDAAATALLLKTNLAQAFQWAADACAQSPTNPDVVSTFAYALHLQGRDSEGLAVLQKLKPAQLKQPSVALYYGVLLIAAGKGVEASPYLQIARSRGQLLPEEKQLLVEAEKAQQ